LVAPSKCHKRGNKPTFSQWMIYMEALIIGY
jgi:hypothetical protein